MLRSRLEFLASLLLASLSLMWIALAKGMPLIHDDAVANIRAAFLKPVGLVRSHFYPGFIWLGTLGGNTSMMLFVFFQALISATLIYLFFKIESSAEFSKRRFLVYLFFLSVVSAISWNVSHITADFSAALLGISGYLVAFRWKRLSFHWKGFVCLAFVFSAVFHHSHLPIIFCASMLAFFLKSFLAPSFRRTFSPKILAILMGVSSLLFIFAQLLNHDRSRSAATIFLFGRMVYSGRVSEVLAEQCSQESPEKDFKLCKYQEDILTIHQHPSYFGPGRYLWHPSSPFQSVGGWTKSVEESKQIILISFLTHPIKNLVDTMKLTIEQAIRFGTMNFDDCYTRFPGSLRNLAESFRDLVPNHFSLSESLRGEKSNTQCVPSFYRWGRDYREKVAALFLAVMILVGLIGLWKRNAEASPVFFFSFLLSNAFVCSFFSGPTNRYQERVMILVLLWAMAKIDRRIFKPRRVGPAADPATF
jgi:hypothetical protein